LALYGCSEKILAAAHPFDDAGIRRVGGADQGLRGSAFHLHTILTVIAPVLPQIAQHMSDTSPTKTIVFGTIATIIIMAATFLVMEGIARIVEIYVPHTEQTTAIVRPNPSGNGSYRLKPNMEITTLVSNRLVHIKLNSFGMNWKDARLEKAKGKTRIAFVGDSFTWGSWASDAAHGLVGVFNSMMPASIEVLNFGVPGYGIDDEELMIKEEVTKFKPDYVVLCFFNGNDFRDTYLGMRKYVIVNGTVKFNERVIQEKVPSKFRHREETGYFMRHYYYRRLKALMRLENLASFRLLKELRNYLEPEGAIIFPSKIVVENNFNSYTFWSATQYPPVAKNAIDVTLATLDRIRNYLAKINIPLAIVTIPYRDQVYVQAMRGPNYDVKFPQVYVEKYARDHGVPYLDLLPPLRKYVRQHNVEIYVKGDVHFNDLGHKEAGALIAQWSPVWLNSNRPVAHQ
jgi:SGNH hydrolase-like domain, acetyltransferase AlgX